MYSKKQILDFAFREAIDKYRSKNHAVKGPCGSSYEAGELEEQIVAEFMRSYAEREGFEFSEAEIHSTIVADIETLNKSGEKLTLK